MHNHMSSSYSVHLGLVFFVSKASQFVVRLIFLFLFIILLSVQVQSIAWKYLPPK